jgi:signal transduction histidine kinase
MQKALFTLLLAVLLLPGFPEDLQAQNKYLDSLKSELQQNGLPDSTRINDLLLLGNEVGYSDSRLARDYFENALRLSSGKNEYEKMGDAVSGIGLTYYRTDNLDTCLYLFRKADTFYMKSNSATSLASQITSKMNIATVLRTMGNFRDALTMYFEGIDAFKKADFPGKDKKLLTAYLNIGLVYNEFNQYDKALFYHRKGLALINKGLENYMNQYYLRMARIHDFIELRRYDSAKYYLTAEEGLYRKLNQADIFSSLYSNWGMYYLGIKDTSAALTSFNKAYRFAADSKNKFRQNQLLSRIATIYLNRKAYRESAKAYEKAYLLSHAIKDKPSEMHYLKKLANLYGAHLHNDHRASRYYKQYVLLADSLNETDVQKKINEIEAKYQTQKKEDSILMLTKNTQLQKAELHRKRTLSTSLLIMCGLLGTLAGAIYLNFKRKNQLLKQSEQLKTQQVREMQKQQQLLAMQSVLKGQEEERSRLAKDLHDGVGGLLSGVKLSLSTMKGNVILSEKNAQMLNNVVVQLDQSMNELRRVSHNMMPESLIKFGLAESLLIYCDSLNETGLIKVQLQTYGMEERMEQNTEIVLYRIIQELLNNVVKHAEAKNVLVQLVRKNNRFNLTVEDDGKGFDLNSIAKNGGAGLNNIRARAEYLGATVDIQSAPAEGTSVNIEGGCA